MANNEFGDFQTPLPLARALVGALPDRPWARVLEPSCGVGNFLRAAVEVFPEADAIGVETQECYVAAAREVAPVVHADVFELDLATGLPWQSGTGPTLVLGNPPWVTNAALSMMGSANRPRRSNVEHVSGIEAMTGSSNFDVAEFIWRKLLAEYAGCDATIALLCKTQVARNILLHSATAGLPVTSASLRLIDAKKWFGASVDACWFTVTLGPGRPDYTAAVYPDLDAATAGTRLGVVRGRLVADVDAYARSADFDGVGPVPWRQGIKHDATAAMELIDDNGPTTKDGVPVAVESEYLYPLFKCTDVHHGRLDTVRRWMVVPQRHPGQDTTVLRDVAPRLWAHLVSRAVLLDGRRSSIYRNSPRFGIFGVGPYTFTDYKIAVSGFHATPRFRMVGPREGRPVVFDDATYLLPFADAAECAVTVALLTSVEVTDLIASLAFWDSKRPVTKKLLQRIDLLAVARAVDRDALGRRALAELLRNDPGATRGDVDAATQRLLDAWTAGPAG